MFIPRKKYMDAFRTWCELTQTTDLEQAHTLFRAYLGLPDLIRYCDYKPKESGWTLPFNDHPIDQMLDELNSPHAYALWKRRKINEAQS